MEDFADAGGDVYVLHSPINYDIFMYKNRFATMTELMGVYFLSCRFDGDDFEDEAVKDPQWGEDEMDEDDIDVEAAAAADGMSF
jgi:hypothetical protein